MIKKKISYLLIFYWIFLWGSINTTPYEIINFGRSFIESINSIRILVPLILSIFIILYFFFLLTFKKIEIKKISIFFFLFFLSQIIGVYLNEERNFDIYNLYLVILAIGTLCLFPLLDYFRLNYLIKYFFIFTIFFLLIIVIFFISLKFNEIKNVGFYIAFDKHETNIFLQANSRITGISRMLAIINLFLILIFFNFKNFYLKKFTMLVIIFISILLFFMQSRGTLLCYFSSLAFIILFLSKKDSDFKIKYFLILVILPPILYFFINKNYNQIIEHPPEKNISLNTNNRNLSISSSGRYEIYSYTIKNYDYKKIFGYGPNGDRYFLKNFNKKYVYGDNTSNIFLYSLVSGGFVSLFFIIKIFYNILRILFQNYKKNISIHDTYNKFSIACLIFFFFRSFFENSFGVFSVDFLITYISITWLIISYNKFKIK